MKTLLGSLWIATTVIALVYAADSRNVVRERDTEERLQDRGAKSKAPDPAAVVDCEACAYGYLWSKDSACLDSAGNIDYASPCDNGMYGAEAIGSVRIIRSAEEPDIAVPKEEPVATCPTDACVEACRDSPGQCESWATKTCNDKHPLPPKSPYAKMQKVTSYKYKLECAIACPTPSGDVQEYECLTQKEIDARKKKRTGPVSLPPGEQSRFKWPCWLNPWTPSCAERDDTTTTASL